MAGADGATLKDRRVHLTLEQKARLREFLADNPNLPQFAVSDWILEHFHVRLGRSTIYRIQGAPEATFTTGNLHRKKRRRVKFPNFERHLLEFYSARREQKQDVSDDELLRQAAECRAACGITDTELKLSNGWLYRFKVRHQLTNVPPQPTTVDTNVAGDSSRNDAARVTHKQQPDPQVGEEQARLATALDTVTIAAQALTVVKAPGHFNWEPTAAFQPAHFSIVDDGVLVTHAGVYEVSIHVRHTAPLQSGSPPACVFKVYCGDCVVGRCEAPADVQNDIATSIWTVPSLCVAARSVLRVEFLAPGYAFTNSSLVIHGKSR